MTNREIVIQVAARALAAGTDPAQVAAFLGAVEDDNPPESSTRDSFFAELDRAEINHQTS